MTARYEAGSTRRLRQGSTQKQEKKNLRRLFHLFSARRDATNPPHRANTRPLKVLQNWDFVDDESTNAKKVLARFFPLIVQVPAVVRQSRLTGHLLDRPSCG